MIHIFLQILVFQLLFLVVYELFLKKETFHNANRIYLLISPLLSIIIPFIKFEFLRNQIPADFYTGLPEVILNQSPIKTEESAFGWIPLLKWIWIAGIAVSFLLLIFKFLKLLKLIKTGNTIGRQSFQIVEIPNSSVAFSFLYRIFLGENIPKNLLPSIIEHEKIHIQQRHGWDLLYFELFTIILWFNPLLYFYKNRITAIHEFIADDKVSSQTGKVKYYQDLLSAVFQTDTVSFVNSFFNQSLIKIRITMLQKTKSTRIKWLKYLFILPVAGMMFFYSACSDNSSETKKELQVPPPPPPMPPAPPSPNVSVTETTEIEEKESIPFSVIDEVPLFPGCTGDNEERKACMSSEITTLVSKNFNTGLAKELDLSGRQRIMVQFKIDDTGNVVDVKARAPHPDLETEAVRVVKMLPKMEPGKQKGKSVAVLYSLPIIFEIEPN